MLVGTSSRPPHGGRTPGAMTFAFFADALSRCDRRSRRGFSHRTAEPSLIGQPISALRFAAHTTEARPADQAKPTEGDPIGILSEDRSDTFNVAPESVSARIFIVAPA